MAVDMRDVHFVNNTVDTAALKENVGAGNKVQEQQTAEEEQKLAAMVCSLENKEDCLMCGS